MIAHPERAVSRPQCGTPTRTAGGSGVVLERGRASSFRPCGAFGEAGLPNQGVHQRADMPTCPGEDVLSHTPVHARGYYGYRGPARPRRPLAHHGGRR